MASKTSTEKLIEKQIKAQEKAERDARIRDRATGLVAGAHQVNGFRIIDSESEAMLAEILKQYDGNNNNLVSFEHAGISDSIACNARVLYEALQMYGMIASTIPYGNGAIITITESAKIYFDNKKDALSEHNSGGLIRMAKKQYEVFLSHANRDKKDYVDELYVTLKKLGINVFYDSEEISWGDKWKDVIMNGTKASEFAIIVISENFFDREWTEIELNEFLSQQNETGQKIVLPLLHDISTDQLKEHYHTLGDIQCISTDNYDKKDIAILLAKELIKRYRDIDSVKIF